MTILTKPVKRETSGLVLDRGMRRVLVTLEPPNVLAFRAKGCRRTYRLTVEAVFTLAVQAHVAAVKREANKNKPHRRTVRRGTL